MAEVSLLQGAGGMDRAALQDGTRVGKRGRAGWVMGASSRAAALDPTNVKSRPSARIYRLRG